jgi:hypothetical protein
MIGNTKGKVYHLPIIFLVVGLLLLVGLAIIAENERVTLIALGLAVLTVMGALGYVYVHIISPQRKFRRKLYALTWNMHKFSIEELKELYQEVYNLYLKLPEHKKANVYASVIKLRESIEVKMKAAKKLEIMIEGLAEGTIVEMQKKYEEAKKVFEELSEGEKKKFQAALNSVTEKLERGIGK